MNVSAPNTHQQENTVFASDANESEHIIVIGGGPVSIRFAQEILARSPNKRITLFGNEPSLPYNRVQLSSLLAGDIAYDDILTKLPDEQTHPNFKYLVKTIHGIDTEFQTVTDTDGVNTLYDKLVIATGSRPHVPNIQGINQTGVYTFRNLKDAEHLYARRSRSRHIVVIGGGLLGLEAARALAKLNTKVTVIQQGERLMNRQLDQYASHMLQADVEALGIEIITQSGVGEIHGRDNRVTGVTTRNGTAIECDTVVICAGIKANLEIARNAKIKVGRGVIVNNQLKTSANNVYAIGECCEHDGLVYGLVNPGFEQAAVAAEVLTGGNAKYLGSLEVSRLKVVGANVCSMGEIEIFTKRPFLREVFYKNKRNKYYRKIIIHKGKIIGAVAYGEWSETRRIQEAYQQQRRIWPWQYLFFKFTGYVWGKNSAQDPALWPATAIICQCNNINQGTLIDAVNSGCKTAKELAYKTGAGSVCGSCKPLLNQLTGNTASVEKEIAWLPALFASLAALIILTTLCFLPEQQVADSVQSQTFFEKIWNDKFWKQVTGFSLLGMSVIGLLMSIRKRIKIAALGKFAYWRLLHIFLGLICAFTLILHTGLHFGENLNQALMLNFIAVTLMGALAGSVMSIAHKLKPASSQKIRSVLTWSHILVTWPLPVLLGLHILTVYYF